MTSLKYTPDDFDKNFCLKPPVFLFFALLYGIKDLIFIIVPSVVSFVTKSSSLDYVENLIQPEMFVTDVLVLLVIISLVKRKDGAHNSWRMVWRYGRLILSLVFLLHFSIYIYGLSELDSVHRVMKHLDLKGISFSILDIVCLAYIFFSQHVKDTFNDWPSNKTKT